MNAIYYAFILGLWIGGNLTIEQVQSKVPKYISQIQCDIITSTPIAPLEPLKTAKIEQA